MQLTSKRREHKEKKFFEKRKNRVMSPISKLSFKIDNSSKESLNATKLRIKSPQIRNYLQRKTKDISLITGNPYQTVMHIDPPKGTHKRLRQNCMLFMKFSTNSLLE